MLRKLAFAVGLLIVGLVASRTARAVDVNFEELTQQVFSVGNSFTSGGVYFHVINFNGVGTQVHVNKQSATQSNTYLLAANSVGIDVVVPPGTGYLAFDFYESCIVCGKDAITVNGATSKGPLNDLANPSLGGVTISLLPAGVPNYHGRLVVEGPISTFRVGGTELMLDNFAIRVPEPATLSSVAVALGVTATWRRRVSRRE